MYPYYARFDEERREADEQRFWFWNSMHFPVPMPAFDAICIDTAYQALGTWQNRVFAVPPAMGIDWRCINGYIYISGNPVTDPAKIAERAGFFQERAGYYYANWDDLYAKWRTKMDALIEELEALEVPQLGEYEPDAVAFEDQETSYCSVLDAYRTALRLHDLMWQNHFEFLLLGYGAYMTFAELCKANLPDIPDQHIAQMVAGLDVLLFKPDAELRRLARLAIDTGVDGAFVEGRSPQEIDATLARERRRPRLARGARERQGSVVPHGDGRRPLPHVRLLVRRPDDPVRLADRLRRRAQGGRGHRAPDGSHRARARAPRDRVRRAPRRRRAQGVRRAARALADGLPVRRGAQVHLRLLVPDELVEQDPRVRRPPRRARLPPRPRRHLPALPPRGVLRARRAAADVGDRRAAARPDVLAADRREAARAARAARRLDAAAGGRRRARGDDGPGADHALGRDDAARPRVGAKPGGRLRADRHGGFARHRRGSSRAS